jgi:hypothetical protein
MRFKLHLCLLFLPVLCSCSWNNPPSAQQEQNAGVIPTRDETVGFFGTIHRAARDTERGAYGLMYGIRDGTDSFIYDVQKDYYDDHQK